MSLKTEKISDIEVKAVKVQNPNENILGAELFDIQYCRVFLAASSTGGKTTTLYNILKHTTDKYCKIFVFSSSHYNDSVWQEIKKLLEKKKCETVYYTDIYDNGVNIVKALTMSLMELKRDEEEKGKEEDDKQQLDKYEYIDDRLIKIKTPTERKEREPKFKSAKHILIFDDMAGILKDPSIAILLKSSRHYNIRAIVLSQDARGDLMPTSIQQLDYILLYGNLPTERLEHIWRHSGLSIPFEQFEAMYNEATKNKYSFFYVNRRSKEPDYRINFNNRFII